METGIVTIKSGGGNAYLLKSEAGAVLVDTGSLKARDKVLAACQGAGVRLILLTHGHFDHCQNAAFLARELGCPVGISPEDRPLLAKGEKRRVAGHGLLGRAFAAASNRSIQKNHIEPVEPAVALAGGMSLEPYGLRGRVVALPGHTLGSVGVLLETGELFAGDAMMGIGRPSGAWCYEDREAARRSEGVIRALEARRVYFGHGMAGKVR